MAAASTTRRASTSSPGAPGRSCTAASSRLVSLLLGCGGVQAKSIMADNESGQGQSVMSQVRTSSGTFLAKHQGSPLRYKDETWSECERSGLAVKPKKGDVLLFFSLHVNATTDTSSLLHGSCPVIEGAKWSTTKWIHVRSFDNPPNVKMDTPCSDDNELCPNWAAIGECHKNPVDVCI
ncbi:hypothetical protein U9M48_010881 [Paspalum notatum var. saurae]|uniref:Procollagen-proline 4-dioxygenase n=1 Tax=Paspalum notatum var. saurae TaxID=547442 RepID=A0AAQ3WGQ4_PASNO